MRDGVNGRRSRIQARDVMVSPVITVSLSATVKDVVKLFLPAEENESVEAIEGAEQSTHPSSPMSCRIGAWGISHWYKRIGDKLDALLAGTLQMAHAGGR